ncbi:MAG: hypothetical protein AAGC55_21295 [Myxococcota bacterium]
MARITSACAVQVGPWPAVAIWLAVLALGNSCVVVPKTVTQEKVVATDVSRVTPGPPGDLILSVRAGSSQLTVIGYRERQCVTHRAEVVEVTRKKELDVEGMSGSFGGGGEAAAVLLVAMPIVAGVSFLISGTVVLLSRSRVERRERPSSGARQVSCPLPAADMPIVVRFPNGTAVRGVTDTRGRAVFSLPAAEPGQGVVMIDAEDRQWSLRYQVLPNRSAPTSAPGARGHSPDGRER